MFIGAPRVYRHESKPIVKHSMHYYEEETTCSYLAVLQAVLYVDTVRFWCSAGCAAGGGGVDGPPEDFNAPDI